ncbi:unnamed protein product [Lymnaea stagnalis]|uniref:RNA-binding region-containing protein 3 n=1 Tax=Lymnaea stagnalis TaxID=6523 RepID=A0AAV2HE02_LYMST
MEECTLLFRHLPAELTSEERKDLLHFFGATRVNVMGKTGAMKNTAFAVFSNKEQASIVLNQLHQVEFLGSKLVVEFAKKQHNQAPSVVDNEGSVEKPDEDGLKKTDVTNELVEPREIKFDTTFNTWGLKHPRRPELRYLYPPPTPSILTNIMNALAAVPKFYVQVLHLMNKMDLPAPFGAVTLTPPLRPDVQEYVVPDDVDQREMDISSETESELESGEEGDVKIRTKETHTVKRLRSSAKMRAVKRPRLSDLQDSELPLLSSTQPLQVSDVFEQVSGAGAKKIELKLPATLLPPTAQQRLASQPSKLAQIYHPISNIGQIENTDIRQQQLPHPNLSASVTLGTSLLQQTLHDNSGQHYQEQPVLEAVEDSYDVPLPPKNIDAVPATESTSVTIGSFGIIEPVHKPRDTEPELEDTEKEWTKSKFISSSELRKSRLSHSEMKELSVFRRYEEGEPSCRLYIKNVAKPATEEDIHWIYGRYVDWDNQAETNIFDIRLMKEGRMKGQAFVTLPSEKVAITALKETNGFVLKDKPIVVQFARSAKLHEDQTKK